MELRRLYLLSSLFWIGISYWNGELIIAEVAVLCHFISWQNHVIEVKLNKLLDDKNISVSMRDID